MIFILDNRRPKLASCSTTNNLQSSRLSDKDTPRLASSDCLLHDNTTFAQVTCREVGKRVDQGQDLGWMASNFDFQHILSQIAYELGSMVPIRILSLTLGIPGPE